MDSDASVSLPARKVQLFRDPRLLPVLPQGLGVSFWDQLTMTKEASIFLGEKFFNFLSFCMMSGQLP